MKSPRVICSFEPEVNKKKRMKIPQYIEETILNFNRKYFEVTNMLNEMRNDFLKQMNTLVSSVDKKIEFASPSETRNTKAVATREAISIDKASKSELWAFGPALATNKEKSGLTVCLSKREKSPLLSSSSRGVKEKPLMKNGFADGKREKRQTNLQYKPSSKAAHTCLSIPHSAHQIPHKKQHVATKCMMNAFAVLLDSNIVSAKDRISIKYLKKELYLKKPLRELYMKAREEAEVGLNQRALKCQRREAAKGEKTFPSKMSQAGICFLTASRENEMLSSEDNKKVIQLIYTILEEGLFSEQSSSKELFEHLFKKYHIDSIKQLFTNVIYEKVFIKTLDLKDDYKRKVIAEYDELEEVITSSIKNPLHPFRWIGLTLSEIADYFDLTNSAREEDLKQLTYSLNKINNYLNSNQ